MERSVLDETQAKHIGKKRGLHEKQGSFGGRGKRFQGVGTISCNNMTEIAQTREG